MHDGAQDTPRSFRVINDNIPQIGRPERHAIGIPAVPAFGEYPILPKYL